MTLEHLPSPSSVPRLILSVSVLPLSLDALSLSSLFLHPSLSHSAFTILFLFSCEVCPVSRLPHQPDRTMGPIFSPGLSPLIRVPARFFPMAEHKTGSLLLGTNPLHPGLSNGLEGAMCLTVYPLQLERSPSLFCFSYPTSFSLRPSHSVYFQTILSFFHCGLLLFVVPFADSLSPNSLSRLLFCLFVFSCFWVFKLISLAAF